MTTRTNRHLGTMSADRVTCIQTTQSSPNELRNALVLIRSVGKRGSPGETVKLGMMGVRS